jgi:hypothetical protein
MTPTVRVIPALLALLLTVPPTPARAQDEDLAVWSAAMINVEFTEHWGMYFEGQNRVQAQTAAARGNRFLLRWAVRFNILPGFTAFAGHAWTPNFSPYKNENRLWQQLSYTHNPGWWLLSGRVRMEERWIQNADEIALRLRTFIRAQYHFNESKIIALAFWDELFTNLNNVNNGPKIGFDQNRVFIGPNFGIGPKARLEIGYMNVFNESHSTTTEDLLDHILATFVMVDF